jgi:DNA/RNA endonuclease YhcR with UshA esterase domain
MQDASRHVGQTTCIMGKVLKVKVGWGGIHFLDFCEEQRICPFSVVVFPRALKDVGDVRRLTGRMIEITGPVKLFAGRPEMILNRISQIAGGLSLVPPLPKDYDVEKQGHYSAGHLYSKKLKTAKRAPDPTVTYGNEADAEQSGP